VRAFALFGIAVVNVDFFANTSYRGVIDTGWDSPPGRMASSPGRVRHAAA